MKLVSDCATILLYQVGHRGMKTSKAPLVPVYVKVSSEEERVSSLTASIRVVEVCDANMQSTRKTHANLV